MTAVNAEQYYKAYQSQEKEYVTIATAQPVKAGGTAIINVGFNVQVSVDEDGYQLSDAAGNFSYLSNKDFTAKTVSADSLELPVVKQDLAVDDLKAIKPVKKGDTICVDVGLPIQTTAKKDGFLVTTEEGKLPIFMSNFELTSTFNYSGKKFETEKILVVVDKEATPRKGIILQEEVTFTFKAGEYTAPAGSLLYVNPDDEDGYTVQPYRSANAALRIAPSSPKVG